MFILFRVLIAFVVQITMLYYYMIQRILISMSFLNAIIRRILTHYMPRL